LRKRKERRNIEKGWKRKRKKRKRPARNRQSESLSGTIREEGRGRRRSVVAGPIPRTMGRRRAMGRVVGLTMRGMAIGIRRRGR